MFHLIKTTVLPPMFWLIYIDSVTPYVFFHDDQSEKQQCYPLCFFSWRPKKNDSVTPHVSFDKNDSITPYVLMDKYWQCYPLCFFLWRPIKNKCYPLCFFSWRPIKNNSVTPYILFDKDNSVTPYVFFHDDQRKTTVLPPMFYLINIDSVTPYILFDKDTFSFFQKCFFFHGDQ